MTNHAVAVAGQHLEALSLRQAELSTPLHLAVMAGFNGLSEFAPAAPADAHLASVPLPTLLESTLIRLEIASTSCDSLDQLLVVLEALAVLEDALLQP